MTTTQIDIECKYKTVPELMQARAAEMPDKTYLVFGDKTWSYREFDEATSRMADAFLKQGAKKGDHIALLIPNSPEFLFCYFGAMKAGCAAVTINTLLKAEELEYIFTDSDAVFLCTTPHYRKLLDPVWERIEGIRELILTDDEKGAFPGALLMQDLLDAGDPGYRSSVVA